MIPFRDALELLLAHTPRMEAESCRLENAAGRTLLREVRADRDFPPYDRVMMDGFALRAADLSARRNFRISGSAPAGCPAVILPDIAGACIEVMTGAPLPLGADCIVPVEQTSRAGGQVVISNSFEAVAGCFIHPMGSDSQKGDLLLPIGTRIGSREIGAAASCGAAWLEVSRLPRIAVVATGDELVAVDETPAPHQIRQSNAHAITCALQRAGFGVSGTAVIGDACDESGRILRQHLESGDWLVLTGAISKGARDFIPALLDTLGCRRLFHGVAQRPGKPAGCWVGPDGQVVMALPGNPVSALTGLHAFVLPALAAAAGFSPPPARMVIPAGRVSGLPGMTQHLPVRLRGDGRAEPAATGNSGDFIGLLRSDGFITLPPNGGMNAAFPFTPWL